LKIMKKTKNIIAILLILAAAVWFLYSCGEDDDAGEDPTEDITEENQTEDDPEGSGLTEPEDETNGETVNNGDTPAATSGGFEISDLDIHEMLTELVEKANDSFFITNWEFALSIITDPLEYETESAITAELTAAIADALRTSEETGIDIAEVQAIYDRLETAYNAWLAILP